MACEPQSWHSLPPYQSPDADGFDKKLRGACHCGTIVYWLSRDKPLASKFCHCQDCRTLHGAPFQWAAIFHKSDMAFETGTRGLRFYNSATRRAEHALPCKVTCANCGTLIMDEGRNMVLLFPTLLALSTQEQRQNFQVQCHLFYPQRVVDIPDSLPKWEGLDHQSRLLPQDSGAGRVFS
ncbi:glutathione-dependent formaldehyde-activating enzyme [Hirsutella rhossiliensis]|uniref:Glutathione-dependent formaldehyde-activating enzyme domain-containing protein n=1 Tax=Hirsutella rhossiliensis TaxID=111463 RepID=A0A9P8SHG2_9HYPO|nr:glutathione-dependent formaldehyde-activating enzyme domain-containing protein [Hirsutella rhossiliensis]KAH0962806.1 glutathione-dependent formaldehyde-activating enzyme domain-containing protein [Hirsutella rhossiliensis]